MYIFFLLIRYTGIREKVLDTGFVACLAIFQTIIMNYTSDAQVSGILHHIFFTHGEKGNNFNNAVRYDSLL